MFDLADYSARVKDQVEAFLDRRLSASGGGAPRLVEAMRYSLFSGGKRIRPLLVYAAAEAVRGRRGLPAPTLLPAPETLVAAAVECIHTYSLVHDDLPAMDNDDLRRGKPTCHKAFDEATAILAGDALLNLGFQILIENIELHGLPSARAARVIGDATGLGGMVTGQVLDLESVSRDPTPERVETIHRNKTGAFLRACVLAGGLAADADQEQERALSSFGADMGLAFQIVDDLLDLEQTTEQLGKRSHKDAEQNKMTYPAAFGIEESRRKAMELTERAEASLGLFGPSAEALRGVADLILKRDH
ncbi:MAG: polyprenyl synthetase family protein [Candidatus Omnitrophica bacterium]|nr:Farnesyl diphosphate synthase [bacterium]NUN95480.1 polyprenyl synthetase family protein [Candidatus Omnitrophota bacterium]